MPTDRRTVARPLPKCQSVRPPVFGVSPEFPPQYCGAGLSPVSERIANYAQIRNSVNRAVFYVAFCTECPS